MYASLPQPKCCVNLRLMETIKTENPKLKSVYTDNVLHLQLALPVEAFKCFNGMSISSDKMLEKLPESEIEEVFRSRSSSLRALTIRNCNWETQSLVEAGEGEDVFHSCSFSLQELIMPLNLPNGMRHLTALESLQIVSCCQLESLPEWMSDVTSLKKLELRCCFLSCSNAAAKAPGRTGQKFNTSLTFEYLCLSTEEQARLVITSISVYSPLSRSMNNQLCGVKKKYLLQLIPFQIPAYVV